MIDFPQIAGLCILGLILAILGAAFALAVFCIPWLAICFCFWSIFK